MQLFITDFERKNNNLLIKNKNILDQIRKVLRMKLWSCIFVQKDNIRHKITIWDRNDETIFWEIIDTEIFNWNLWNNWILIALSNKRDKIELIVQKLSEVWIKNIYFRPSERSIIRERNEKKENRLNLIAKEAIEQSRWRFLPKIQFKKDISDIISIYENILVFNQSDKQIEYWWIKDHTLWIIWPEWWFTSNDFQNFGTNYQILSLWNNILRTETASIIAWRLINN